MIEFTVLLMCAAHVHCAMPLPFVSDTLHTESKEMCRLIVRSTIKSDGQNPDNYIIVCTAERA